MLTEFSVPCDGPLPFDPGHPAVHLTSVTATSDTQAAARPTKDDRWHRQFSPGTGPVTGTAVKPAKKRKFFLLDLYRTAVGKKYVDGDQRHDLDRLRRRPHDRQPEDVPRRRGHLNHYGEFLRELLVPILPRTVALWLLRFGLIGVARRCTSTRRTG